MNKIGKTLVSTYRQRGNQNNTLKIVYKLVIIQFNPRVIIQFNPRVIIQCNSFATGETLLCV